MTPWTKVAKDMAEVTSKDNQGKYVLIKMWHLDNLLRS